MVLFAAGMMQTIKLTDDNQDEESVDETGIDALAVCIGNVRGKYPSSGPNFGLDLLEARVASLVLKERRVPVPGALWSF
ncbi:ketose-bisphosphate aldolase class-II family protein [Melia azedarach]|uniref:Ketose-bisphosphate aldolase class-II family protein n=1 Tax=Melia azedarach TaxID=155640 RepID=A0ACC1YJA5_MELAZ|nr:ketose-bisphosphate aldolase class-II family protein [Melia azedarach]